MEEELRHRIAFTPKSQFTASNITTHSIACEELPEKYALRSHLMEVTDVVELNLNVIGTRLVEKGFITQRQLCDITETLGQTAANKASSLMRSVVSKIDRSDKREEWFEKFVLILANDTTESELVEKLTKAFGRLDHRVYGMQHISNLTFLNWYSGKKARI